MSTSTEIDRVIKGFYCTSGRSIIKEDSSVIGNDFNTLSISWIMLCIQESKMIIFLLVERATYL